ncbi:hypothetical protein KKG36_01495 [Patescibacteria group bacterium]|nr:hypothetical protein [Patescibacteria group bacterium]
MGTYYNPGTEVQTVGRKLNDKGPDGSDYEKLMAQLQEGEVLFGVVDVFVAERNPVRAMHIQSQDDLTGTWRAHWQGYYKILGFYAVPRTKAEQGCGSRLP